METLSPQTTWIAEQLTAWRAQVMGGDQSPTRLVRAQQDLLARGVLYQNPDGVIDQRPGPNAPWASQ
ncbi:hypothetical protein A2Y99_00090 [Candidatus Gottesmanbacteria bacterium RBG_13_37_7]|uniref:Uncharacterized protein n=1 Tax=Candidatus Gottesmanbacteria bacterium RBG_13_37_7 TaxID=1798369 RepID=A0A1F5YGY2_9BACT|nr:MAG: hypothetical protein A2Y99_00090 [Candidatus Gottesmanbacteria bacterium RBG_13_37_7]